MIQDCCLSQNQLEKKQCEAHRFCLPKSVNDGTIAFANNIVVPEPSFRVNRFTHTAKDF